MIRQTFAFVVALSAGAAAADAAILAGSSADRAASAEFTASGSQLTVRLTNTSTADVMDPTRILTAVFFDVSGDGVALTPVSAMLAAGSAVSFGPDGGGNVGGEWGYRNGIVGGPSGLSYGISSSGFGLFGPGNNFPGANLEGPTNPGGMNYGIVSAGDNLATGNAAVTGGNPLIKNSVTFTLTCPNGFDANRITRAFFQYGTALDEGGFEVPAPGAGALFGLGVVVIGRRRR